MRTTFIYALKCPITGKVRYVGKANDPFKRFRQHMRGARSKKKSVKYSWLRSLIKRGLEPELEILEECDIEEWQEREKWWISQWGLLYLTNATEGGEGLNLYKKNKGGHKNAKPIEQIDINTGEVLNTFPSIKAAIESVGAHKNSYSISNVCKGKEHSAYGFKWRYAGEETPHRPKKKQGGVKKATRPYHHGHRKTNSKNYNGKRFNKRTMKVQMLHKTLEKVLMEFETLDEAAEHVGHKTNTCISDVCRGIHKSAGGYRWRYSSKID